MQKYCKLNIYLSFPLNLIIIGFVFIVFNTNVSYSAIRDSTIFSDTLKVEPFSSNKIENSVIFNNLSDSISIDNIIWNDRRNLNEILNEVSGFYINSFGVSSKGSISYNGSRNVGIYRDGIQINDFLFEGFDAEFISVNEIQKIELVSDILSFLYGANSQAKTVNIISKNKFLPKLFSQLRYTQDRDGALSADFQMNFPASKKLNIILGLNNSGSDGRYKNTDFSIWRSRLKLNYYPSKKINLKYSFYYSKLNRGLFEGLNFSTEDTLNDPKLATVINSDSYEKKTGIFSDLMIISNLINDSTSFTKIRIYTQNIFREYRDEENRDNSNGISIMNNFHNIIYGLDIDHNFRINLSPESLFLIYAGLKYNINLYNYNLINFNNLDSNNTGDKSNNFSFSFLTGYSRADFFYKNLRISAGIKTDFYNNNLYPLFGIEAEYLGNLSNNKMIKLSIGGNSLTKGFNYSSILRNPISILDTLYNDSYLNSVNFKIELKLWDLYLILKQYSNNNLNIFENGSYEVKYKNKFIEANILFDNFSFKYMPDYFLKSEITYFRFLFKNKLFLKTGLILKYNPAFQPMAYSQYTESFQEPNLSISKSNFNIDLFLGAKIGKANLSIVIANLFNNLNYDTTIYPWDNRGGFLNSISRFTITWDFLD